VSYPIQDFISYSLQPNRIIIMKTSLFLAVPAVMTAFNLGFAIFLNRRHSQADAAVMVAYPDRHRGMQQVQRRSNWLILE
jgi:hypothetical protein